MMILPMLFGSLKADAKVMLKEAIPNASFNGSGEEAMLEKVNFSFEILAFREEVLSITLA